MLEHLRAYLGNFSSDDVYITWRLKAKLNYSTVKRNHYNFDIWLDQYRFAWLSGEVQHNSVLYRCDWDHLWPFPHI
jgi:hypothetical protein